MTQRKRKKQPLILIFREKRNYFHISPHRAAEPAIWITDWFRGGKNCLALCPHSGLTQVSPTHDSNHWLLGAHLQMAIINMGHMDRRQTTNQSCYCLYLETLAVSSHSVSQWHPKSRQKMGFIWSCCDAQSVFSSVFVNTLCRMR